MYEINIWDVLSLLGLGEPKYGSSSFNVRCPCCDDGRDKHLNINISCLVKGSLNLRAELDVK